MIRQRERCYLPETLYSMFSDEKNYAILSCLKSILIDVQKVNKLFESNNADPTRLYLELKNLLQSLISKITSPNHRIELLEENIDNFIDRNCYLGFNFEDTIKKMKENGLLTKEDEIDIRNRIITFISVLIKQIRQRFPENYDVLQNISLFSVQNTLKHNKPSVLPVLKYFAKTDLLIDDIERERGNIHLLKWTETNNTEEFWYEVASYRNANDENPFANLVKFVLEVLILPYSNAEEERLFSKLNIFKNKLRNRLNCDTTNALFYIKCSLLKLNKCCDNYNIPKDVLEKIKTIKTYENADLIPDDI